MERDERGRDSAQSHRPIRGDYEEEPLGHSAIGEIKVLCGHSLVNSDQDVLTGEKQSKFAEAKFTAASPMLLPKEANRRISQRWPGIQTTSSPRGQV